MSGRAGAAGLRRRTLTAWLGAAALAPRSHAQPQPRPASLARGLNLTHWFEYERSVVVPSTELAEIRRHGFDHVRIPVDPVTMGWQLGRPAMPDWRPLRVAVDAALGVQLDVVVDLHLVGETKQAIEDDSAHEAALIALWRSLAKSLVDTPPQRVVAELFNEPQYYSFAGLRWPGLQRRLLAAVRAELPRHTLLLSGARGGSLEGLQVLTPVDDVNVAYVFHHYEPMLFSHQGAEWMDPRWTTAGLYGDIRYPAAMQLGVDPKLRTAHPKAADELARYRREDWSRARVAQALRPAGDWMRRHRRRVVCNEFGVIRRGVDAASRYRFLADVRSALEAERIGWTLWDYADIFGIVQTPVSMPTPGSPGTRRIEPAALAALGMAA